MGIEGQDHRRHPRLPVACRVELRDRFVTWSCETADIGPRGCQIVTSRAPVLGALLGLGIASERLPSPLEVAGQVTWVQKGPQARAGISFLGSIVGAPAGPTDWFRELLGAELSEADRRGELVPSLAEMVVYLGAPPPSCIHALEEREVLGLVGAGVGLADLVARSASGTVAALLRRGWLTLARTSAVSPERWMPALSGSRDRGGARQFVAADLRGGALRAIEIAIDVQSPTESATAETVSAEHASA